MNQAQLTVTVQALKAQLNRYEGITVCCRSCINWERRQCTHHQAEPPAHWVIGPIECSHWIHDEVPF